MEGVFPFCHDKAMGSFIPISQSRNLNRDIYLRALPGFQGNPLESRQLLGWTDDIGIRKTSINLHYLIPGKFSGILNFEVDIHCCLWLYFLLR